MRPAYAIFAAALVGLPAASDAQTFVPFVIPARPSGESLMALPALPPIEPDSPRLLAREGHFHLGAKRVRIWGVNLCFGASFPAHQDAEWVASRLSAAGINSVRFHHMDSTGFPRGIWDPGDPKKLSAEALDRLDYLIDQLARCGIYANLNLHVSRTHSRVLKLPETEKLRNYDKIVDIFTPALMDAQKAYARDLLGHVNKYRKVRYADDPAVGFVEINNEDSLFMWGAEETLADLPPCYAAILGQLYAAWLKGRYGTPEKLRAAWAHGAEPLGQNLLGGLEAAGRAWRLEQHAGCRAKLAPTEEGVRIEIAQADATRWHVQFNHSGLALKGGRYYTLSFRARSDKPRQIGYNVGQAREPWGMLGLTRAAELTKGWESFRVGFVASADEADGRVNFQLGGSDAAVELADVELRPGGREGLREGESLQAGDVALFAETETTDRLRDRWRFLAETEKAHFDQMRRFIKEDLGCKALVTGTIVFGLLGLYGQSEMDYIDGHAYWQHPRFPGRPWDPADWTVEQKAMVDHLDESPLFRLACQRLEGRPYTVSEYNHPAPNDYQAECVPMITSFAAAQDWDGVWLFAYSHRTDDWDAGCFRGFFDIDHNPAKWGFVPAGAIIFREGSVLPLPARRVVSLARAEDPREELIDLHIRHGSNLSEAVIQLETDEFRRVMGRSPSFFEQEGESRSIFLFRRRDLLARRISLRLTGKDEFTLDGPDESTPRRGVLTWMPKADDRHGVFTYGTRALSLALAGAGGAGSGEPRVVVRQPGFAVVTVTPLSEDKLLITACGRCENTDMGFPADRRTVGRNWGKAPVRIEAVEATIQAEAGNWTCQALRPDGSALSKVPPITDNNGREVWRLSPEYQAMWYLLERK